MAGANCIFCRIIASESPCEAIWEDAQCLAFMDINPVNDGHCLVIPKAHYENLFAMPPEAFGRVASAAAAVARAVDAELRPGGMNLVQANGAFARQSVFHVHIHVLPRREGDNLLINWDPQRGDSTRIAEIAARLRVRLRA